MNGYRVYIHVDTLEEAQAVQELALEAFGYPVTITQEERDRPIKPANEWRSGRVALAHMQCNPTRTFTREDISIVMEEAGFSASTANSVLSKLVIQGFIKRLGTGVYRLNSTEKENG